MQHKLICIEVYLHSALTHSSARKSSSVKLACCSSPSPSRLCGNGKPSVHRTPTYKHAASQACLSTYLKSTVVPALVMWNIRYYTDHFTSNTQTYSELCNRLRQVDYRKKIRMHIQHRRQVCWNVQHITNGSLSAFTHKPFSQYGL